jgi:hypothetical protein
MRKSIFFGVLYLLMMSTGFPQQAETISKRVDGPVYFDISPPLRDMVKSFPLRFDHTWKDGVVKNYFNDGKGALKNEFVPDASRQGLFGTTVTDTTIENFEGVGNINGVVPPDTHGEVGPDNYFQVVNLSYAIYNKTGVKIFGPYANSSVWSGMPNNSNSGDAVVLYDENANRWLFTQFSLPNYPNGPFYQMIAVSQTPDPTGSWYRWEYSYTQMPDYPKFGIWPDGYYMSSNNFSNSSYVGNGISGFDRTAMLAGDPNAQRVYFSVSSGEGFVTFLPADCDGTFPPAGTPNYFAYMKMSGTQHFRIYEFHSDWANTTNATFTNVGDLNVNSFNTFSGGGVAQKGTTRLLDPITDRLMYKLQFRQFNGYSAMVTNHTVNTGSSIAGIRWYELRNSGSGWTIYQQSTYAPSDNNSRWMGSVAMDTAGSIALGFSVSGTNMYPSIRYTGRFRNDALNTMTVAERGIMNGGGAQTGQWSGRSRWGDYSGISVDPSAPTTFWYTQEYYSTTSDMNWQTRVGSFTFGNAFTIDISSNPLTICEGDSSQLNVVAHGGSGAYTYSWTSDPAGFTSTIRNPVVHPTITTNYIATVNDGTNSRTDTTHVNLVLLPTSFAGNDTTVCQNIDSIRLQGVATSYRLFGWETSGDGHFGNSESLTTGYKPGAGDIATGSVDLQLIVIPLSPCSGNVTSTMHVVIDNCNAIPQTKDEAFHLSVSPNPSNGSANILLTGLKMKPARITVTDSHGVVVYSDNISGADQIVKSIDLSADSKGIYLVKAESEIGSVSVKMVVK